jgi:hypothetical protein
MLLRERTRPGLGIAEPCLPEGRCGFCSAAPDKADRGSTADRTHWGAREIMESIVCTAPAGD